MKIKYVMIAILSVLLIISVSQIFSIPPFAEDIYPIYKSGYFIEIERGFDVIKESFIEIKMLSKPVYAWIFLDDMKKKYKMDIKVFNSRGEEKTAPGEIGAYRDERVINILNSLNTAGHSEIVKDKYYSVMPVVFENRCKFCHNTGKRRKIAGALTFSRDYSAHIYYSSERILIFSVISVIISFFIFVVIKWDPARVSRELFDK